MSFLDQQETALRDRYGCIRTLPLVGRPMLERGHSCPQQRPKLQAAPITFSTRDHFVRCRGLETPRSGGRIQIRATGPGIKN